MTAAEKVLTDAVVALGWAVEALANITPNTEREYAKARRREVRETAAQVRESVAALRGVG